jgi:hypothetical protein
MWSERIVLERGEYIKIIYMCSEVETTAGNCLKMSDVL